MAMAGTGEDASPPKNRLKFMCSLGGKILPRPSDGQLKYVGGDTRVVVVPRSINFSDLMRKIRSLFDAEVVIKYQLMPEDLDALVSVTCDEDLRHMIHEYDTHEARSPTGVPRLRVFLFPATPAHVPETPAWPHHQQQHTPLEQRYIDAINGVVRSPTASAAANHRSIFTLSSGNSSPRGSITEINYDAFGLPLSGGSRDTCQLGGNNGGELHRPHSSPNLYALGQPQGYGRQQQPPLSRMHSLHAGGPGHAGVRGCDVGGCHVSQVHPAPTRRYQNHYSPAVGSGGGGPRGGCVCCGLLDDGCGRRSEEYFFPAAPLKPVWE